MNGLDLNGWRPELGRALMKTRPEYFAWPREQRERYGASIPEADRKLLDAALSMELFGREYSCPDETESMTQPLSPEEQERWNETVLALRGVGEDRFFLNEFLPDEKSILDFETVRDFDENDYCFQEEARRNEDPAYPGKPYRGSLYLNWARLFVDGRFTYATLSMAAEYLYSRLSQAASELLEERIPHRHVPGKNHGKVEGGQWEWDMRIEANGQEGVLEELQHRIWKYEHTRFESLILRTYDPKIARLRKRRKVLVMKGAFDSLQ